MSLAVAPDRNVVALLKLAGPIALSQVAQTSMGFVDTAMVGRIGPVDLAAVALGSSIFIAILLLSLGTVLAVGPLVSQAVGAGDDAGISTAARQGLWLAAFLTPVVVALLYLARLALPYLGPEPEVANLAAAYLGAVSWSVLPFLGFGAVRSWLEGLNRPLPVTLCAISAVGVNAAANYMLIYGKLGVPALGAVGTGYATSISYAYLFLVLAAYARSRKNLRQYGVFARLGSPDRAKLRELLRIGTPIGLSFGLEVGMFTVTAILIGGIGAEALAAHQIALQLGALAFMLPLSVSLAATIRVGNLVGAGFTASARRAGWLAIAMGAGVMCVSATIFTVFPQPLVSLFIGAPSGENSGVAELAVQLLAIAAIFQIVDGIQGTAAGALRGLKDTFVPMLIGLLSYWAIGLSSGYYLAGRYGARGLWIGLCIGLACAAVLLVWRWNRLATSLRPRGPLGE